MGAPTSPGSVSRLYLFGGYALWRFVVNWVSVGRFGHSLSMKAVEDGLRIGSCGLSAERLVERLICAVEGKCNSDIKEIHLVAIPSRVLPIYLREMVVVVVVVVI